MKRFFVVAAAVAMMASSAMAADLTSVTENFNNADTANVVFYQGDTRTTANPSVGEHPSVLPGGFRWGGWSSTTAHANGNQIGFGFTVVPVVAGPTVTNLCFRPNSIDSPTTGNPGTYAYTIFDPTNTVPPATPDVVKNLESVTVVTQGSTSSDANTSNVDIKILLRDGAGEWWLSDQATPTKTIQTIDNTYVITIAGMTWGQVNAAARDDMNAMDDDAGLQAGPGAITVVAGTPDFSSVTGGGIYFASDVTSDGVGAGAAYRLKSMTWTGALPPAPGVAVTVNSNPVADGETVAVDLGSYEVAEAAADVVFTVSNPGALPLTVSGITVPAGVTIVEDLTAGDIAAAGSDTFTVKIDTAAEATITGEISFTTNVTGANPFNFAVSGQVGPVTAVREWQQY